MRGMASNYEAARFQQRLWTPRHDTSIGGMWLDSSAAHRTEFNSTSYMYMRDQWGRSPLFEQGAAALAPGLTYLNGVRCANYDKTNGLMMEYYTATCSMANSFTMGIVCSINAAGTNARPITLIGSANSNDYDNSGSIALISRYAANSVETYQNNARRATTTIVDASPMIFIVESNGTTCYHWLNGSAGGSGAWGTINLGTCRMGVGVYSSGAAVTNYQGLWGEMIAARIYSPNFRQRLEGYLAHKWRLQEKLPGTHPFRNSPPLIGG